MMTLSKDQIKSILLKTINEIIPEKKIETLEESFISEDSRIESIEVAQIIVRIEELLSESGIEGYDLFEKLFAQKNITFESLIDLIYQDVSE